jgi:putative ABC transport system substrate-binding protein
LLVSRDPSFGVELRPIDIRKADEIERAVAAFARSSNGGLIVTAGSGSAIHRDLIVKLAAPGINYPPSKVHTTSSSAGGLISYGPDRVDQYRQAAGYTDRILKG